MSEKPSQTVPMDEEVDQDTLCRIKARLAHIMQLYNAGKPFFPRALLEDLNRQIDAGAEEVYINDLDDMPQKYSLKVPKWCADFATYRINYSSIQHLGHLTPICPELALRHDHTPVSIVYARSVRSSSCYTLEQVRARFTQTRDLWLASSTRRHLDHVLSTLPLSAPITKIVCFALGSLAPLDDSDSSDGSISLDNSTSNASPVSCSFAWHVTRAHAQHAAVGTILAALRKRDMLDPLGVRCYAQDPAYDAVDCEFLASIGITVLDDPKGFLEVDASTLVVSVSPNVPVKQIVADVQWPAAMVWNTVALVEKEPEPWVKNVEENGEVQWSSPFTTDPDCARVRTMIKDYARAALDDANDFFGDITVYMK